MAEKVTSVFGGHIGQRARVADSSAAQAGPSPSIYTNAPSGRSYLLALLRIEPASRHRGRRIRLALLRPLTASANIKEKKEPADAGLSHERARYEQPFQPLDPAARLA
jgi:hypothetical protein